MNKTHLVVVNLVTVLLFLPSIPAHPCAQLLPPLLHYCAHPTKSSPQTCCYVLYHFGSNNCYCEDAAYQAATAMALNEYGFIWRQKACDKIFDFKSQDWKHQGFPGSRGTDAIPPTCPVGGFNVDGCGLKKQRMASMMKLLNINNTGITDAAVDAIFEENATLSVVGVGSFTGKKAIAAFIKDRVMSKIVPWNEAGSPGMFNVAWRQTGDMSYQLGRNRGRIDFVHFSNCTAKIEEFTILYSGSYIGQLMAQYVYPGQGSLFDETTGTPKKWCGMVNQYCKGDLNPFKWKNGCQTFFTNRINQNKITCTYFKGNNTVPTHAWGGDSVACRAFFIRLAKLNPQEYCPKIINGTGMCMPKQCPGNTYSNIFKESAPRYLSSNFFSCSKTACTEQGWP